MPTPSVVLSITHVAFSQPTPIACSAHDPGVIYPHAESWR